MHTTEVNDGYDWGRLNLQSVTAESSLQEFLSTAELAQREFTAEKLNLKYVTLAPKEVQTITSQPNFDEPLTIPRRWVSLKILFFYFYVYVLFLIIVKVQISFFCVSIDRILK